MKWLEFLDNLQIREVPLVEAVLEKSLVVAIDLARLRYKVRGYDGAFCNTISSGCASRDLFSFFLTSLKFSSTDE